MAITVNCPNCRASFRVDDKYAGRQGPCPKCKSTITIPKVDKVVIHEESGAAVTAEAAAAGPKAKSATQAVRPIARTEVQFRIVPAIAIVGAIAATFAVSYFLGPVLQIENFRGLALRVTGLLLVGVFVAIGSYAILRNDELEPYRGGALWWRTLVCVAVYVALWVGFYYIPADIKQALYNWAFILPVLLVIGGATATILYDLDFSSGAFHYVIYLAVTVLLGKVAGLGWPWLGATL